MAAFDLFIHGGTVVDGSGRPGRRADVGVSGDRIVAVGDLSAAAVDEVELVLDVTGRVVAPGSIDPHGHSDGSVLLDGALASGIEHVIVNGRPAILSGSETGDRPGRLLRP